MYINIYMSWQIDNLTLVLDITTHCNAKCPQCSRTNEFEKGLPKVDWLPLTHVPLDDLKKYYTKEELKLFAKVNMCPSWGDPMMHPDIFNITDYFLENISDKKWYKITTNGSMRDEDFWFKFGSLAHKHPTKKFLVTFDVDGINQEMHSKYRRNTDLSKVLANMKAFSENGKSFVRSQSVIFKHNQDYIDDIRELVKQYGSTNHTWIKSRRFVADPQTEKLRPSFFINENGDADYLEWADKEFENDYLNHYNDEDIGEEVKCRWAMSNTIEVNFDGQVHPCCFLGNPSRFTANIIKHHEVMKAYNLKENNIKHNSLTNIIQNRWFSKQLPESIKCNPTLQCVNNCSTKNIPRKNQQLRSNEKL